MMKQKIIEKPSISGWTSNSVLVRKKDNTLRFCVDYRRLNVSQKDAYPLSRIDDYLDALNGASWFSTFDLRSGYLQELMDEESRDKRRDLQIPGHAVRLTGAPATF